jgi:hypothetical protein
MPWHKIPILLSISCSTMPHSSCPPSQPGAMSLTPGCPHLRTSAAQVRHHPPYSTGMMKGHLDQQCANIWSTKPKPQQPISIEHRQHTDNNNQTGHQHHPITLHQQPTGNMSNIHQSHHLLPCPIHQRQCLHAHAV